MSPRSSRTGRSGQVRAPAQLNSAPTSTLYLGDFVDAASRFPLLGAWCPGHPPYAVPCIATSIGVVINVYWPPNRWTEFPLVVESSVALRSLVRRNIIPPPPQSPPPPAHATPAANAPFLAVPNRARPARRGNSVTVSTSPLCAACITMPGRMLPVRSRTQPSARPSAADGTSFPGIVTS